MSTFKNLQKFLTSKNVVFLASLLVLSLALANYSFLKNVVVDGMAQGSYPEGSNPSTGSAVFQGNGKLPQDYDDVKTAQCRGINNVVGASYDMMSSSPENVSGGMSLDTSKDFSPVGVEDPSSLLPIDNNSEWSRLNPVLDGNNLQNLTLVSAAHHIGIDTVSQSLRNANLQIRSEPPNPQINVGPFNISTIGPDLTRPNFEIGTMCM